MYNQVEKPKENKSRAVANNVGQQKSYVKQSFGFVDNRPETTVQRKNQYVNNRNSQTKQATQLVESNALDKRLQFCPVLNISNKQKSPLMQDATLSIIQRVNIRIDEAGLDLETDTTTGSEIINAMQTLKNAFPSEPLSNSISSEEAKAILRRLRDLQFDTPKWVSDELDEAAHYWDEPEFAVNKIDLARQIITVLRVTGGLPVFLSGGGAVTLSGGPRAIKDLDLRVDLPPDRTFSIDDELSTGLIDGINDLLTANFNDVDLLSRSDEKSGMTIAGHVDGVEISITRTPAVRNMSLGPDDRGVVRLGEFDLIMDKAYSFAMRRKGDFEKRITDLIDMLSLINSQRGLVTVFRGLNALRGDAYGKQAEMANKRAGKEIYDPNLLLEFHERLREMVDRSDNVVKVVMKKYNALELYPLISFVISETGKYLDNPVPITVI